MTITAANLSFTFLKAVDDIKGTAVLFTVCCRTYYIGLVLQSETYKKGIIASNFLNSVIYF